MGLVSGQSAVVVPTGQSVALGPFPPAQCGPGQVPCEVLGCVEQEQLCDGEEDCLDGSDERLCGEQGTPQGPQDVWCHAGGVARGLWVWGSLCPHF